MEQTAQLPNVFSVDVEDYYHVSAFDSHVVRADWPTYESRVVGSTQRILELLARHQVRGTFFILGWVAQRYPALVREIQGAGHEVGSHSYWHRLVYQQTPAEFREDLRRSRDVLTDVTGEAVTCYRAPSFSITRQSWWALEILLEEGFTVDSSIAGLRHDRYGVADAETGIHEIETPSGNICEFPPSVLKFGRLKIGLAGGGYFRLFPTRWMHTRVTQYLRATQGPLVFYTHPWEVDPEQPRVRAGSRLSRFRHYVNLGHTESRLEKLLGAFPFTSMQDILKQRAEEQSPHRGEECLV